MLSPKVDIAQRVGPVGIDHDPDGIGRLVWPQLIDEFHALP